MIYLGAIGMTFIGASGAFFFKKSTEDGEGFFSALKSWRFYVGGVLYVIAAVLNIILLRYMDYTVLYPMTAITYIWTLLLSRLFLNESVEKKKLLGVLVICCGVFLVAQ